MDKSSQECRTATRGNVEMRRGRRQRRDAKVVVHEGSWSILIFAKRPQYLLKYPMSEHEGWCVVRSKSVLRRLT